MSLRLFDDVMASDAFQNNPALTHLDANEITKDKKCEFWLYKWRNAKSGRFFNGTGCGAVWHDDTVVYDQGQVDDRNAEALAHVLATHHDHVKVLNVFDKGFGSGNTIRDTGAVAIAKLLETNSTITQLRLQCTGKRGFAAIAAALLSGNNTVQEVNFSGKVSLGATLDLLKWDSAEPGRTLTLGYWKQFGLNVLAASKNDASVASFHQNLDQKARYDPDRASNHT